MLNIVIPLGGTSKFFSSDEYQYPESLVEVSGKPMIEMVIDNFKIIDREKRFIFIVKESDCLRYHIDNILTLLTDGNCIIVKTRKETMGAACSVLLAIEHINNDDELIIANSNQVIDVSFNDILDSYCKSSCDAGVVCFQSVHPKWSYARAGDGCFVQETAEKHPISKNAIAGFYYFRYGRDFIFSAMKSIERDASVENKYFIAPTLNELILNNCKILMVKIDNSQYHSFYSPRKIKEYEEQYANKEN